MCITDPLKISDFQGNLLHMLLFSQKHAFYFSILRIKEGLSHVQQPLLYAMQFSIFARSFSLIAAEHPVKVAGITKAAAICNLRDGIFGGA